MSTRSLVGLLPVLLAATLWGAESELKYGDTVVRYVVDAPEGVAPAGTADPARQVGLILCFPEHDRPTGDEILPVREALKRLGVRDQYVLVGVHPQERKFGAKDHEPIAKVIAWAKQNYPVNPRRLYLYGKGEGNKISGEVAMANPKVVTAAMTYSWGWWRMPSELSEAIDAENSAPEFYMVLGLRDLSYHLTTVRDTYARVSAKGYKIIYREFADLGARTYHQPSNDDGIAWMTRLRNKNLPLSAGEQKLLANPIVNAAGYYAGLALVGGAAAGPAVEKLLASPDANVRAAAAETCRHAIFREQTMQALGRLLTDPSAKVRSVATRALAWNANWRSQAAQTAIVDFLSHPEKAVTAEDRAAAADALIYAIRLQRNGARQDVPLFRALVALLEDKNEELRTMANNTLMTIRDPEFRGDLGRPEQKAPEGGWQNWLEQVSVQALGYRKDYEVCGNKPTGDEAVAAFCAGGSAHEPAAAFQHTLKAAEAGYVPAQNAVALLYANGKGTEQNYAEAAKWWMKAAEAGHLQAAFHLSMVYRGGAGVKSDPALSAKWGKLYDEKRVRIP